MSVLLLAAAIAVALVDTTAAQSPPDLEPGQVLFTSDHAVLAVDPSATTDDFVIVTEFSPTDGIAPGLRGLVQDPLSGDIFVIDSGETGPVPNLKHHGRILRITTSGDVSVIGGCIDFVRPDPNVCFDDPIDVALLPDGRLVVSNPRRDDTNPPSNNDGELWIVDPSTGSRQLAASGDLLWDPHNLAVDPVSGLVYVVDNNSQTSGGGGAVIAVDLDTVDPATGLATQTLVSDDTSIAGKQPVGIGLDDERDVLGVGVAFGGVATITLSDPVTPASSQVLVGLDDEPLLGVPMDVEFREDGTLVLADFGAGVAGMIFDIDPSSGDVTPVFETTVAMATQGYFVSGQAALVVPLAARIDALLAQLEELVAADQLSKPEPLRQDLLQARRAIDRTQPDVASVHLHNFTSRVETWLRQGRISAANAELLVATAEAIIDDL